MTVRLEPNGNRPAGSLFADGSSPDTSESTSVTPAVGSTERLMPLSHAEQQIVATHLMDGESVVDAYGGTAETR